MLVKCVSSIIRNVENPLLGRKEVTIIFKDASGKLTKNEGIEQVVKELKVKPESVIPMSLKGKYGTRDIIGIFYVYKDINLAKKQLPEYIFSRMLPKEDRKKLLDERKKKAVPAAKKPAK